MDWPFIAIIIIIIIITKPFDSKHCTLINVLKDIRKEKSLSIRFEGLQKTIDFEVIEKVKKTLEKNAVFMLN